MISYRAYMMYILSLLTLNVNICLSEAGLMTDSRIFKAQQDFTQSQISNLTTSQHIPSLSTQVPLKPKDMPVRSLKLSDINCDAAPSTCSQTASAYNSTQQWKKFCFFGYLSVVRACSEICIPGSEDYHRNLCWLKCGSYTQACSQETTKPPLYTNWVHSPTCNATTDHCQMKGLNHTKFYNISCYSYKLIDKTIMKSCFDTCRSNRTEDQIECRQSCTEFNASCSLPDTKTTENSAKIRRRDSQRKNILRNEENAETEEHSFPIGFAVLVAICIVLPLAVIIGTAVLVCRREQRNRVNNADNSQNTIDAQVHSEMELLNADSAPCP